MFRKIISILGFITLVTIGFFAITTAYTDADGDGIKDGKDDPIVLLDNQIYFHKSVVPPGENPQVVSSSDKDIPLTKIDDDWWYADMPHGSYFFSIRNGDTWANLTPPP